MTPWLTVIGIGADGLAGLSPLARSHLAQASVIFGGARHLGLLAELAPTAERHPWPSPFAAGVAEICARRGQPTLVLASGDPFFYGVGSVLSAQIPAAEMLCLPAPSSLALAAARMGWAQQEARIVSLHGRPLERVIPWLHPHAQILALSWDGATPGRLAGLLCARGLATAQITVLENLGGAEERRHSFSAEALAAQPEMVFADLNLIALALGAERGQRIPPRSPGLPDDWFEHDGQITKRDIRAVTLSALAPWPGALLWDIGAGSGSVAIEWLLADPRNRAIAVERHPERAARIARNAAALGVPELEVRLGRAPEVLADLPRPDAVFIGGGGPEVIAAAWAALPVGARLVANGVTLETHAALSDLHARYGGALLQISLARARPLGPGRGWDGAMPVVQWSIDKT